MFIFKFIKKALKWFFWFLVLVFAFLFFQLSQTDEIKERVKERVGESPIEKIKKIENDYKEVQDAFKESERRLKELGY